MARSWSAVDESLIVGAQGIEREARGQRYVLVTEPARDGGKVVHQRDGVAVFG